MSKKINIEEIREKHKTFFNMLDKDIKNNKAEMYVILNNVSSSGMSRRMSVYYFFYDKKTKRIDKYYLNYLFKEIGYSLHKDGSIKFSGCGLDVGHALISAFSETFYGNYKLIKHIWL